MSGAPALTAGGTITGGVGMATTIIAGGALLAQAGKSALSPVINALKGTGGKSTGGLSPVAQAAGTSAVPSNGSAVGGLNSFNGNAGTPQANVISGNSTSANAGASTTQRAAKTSASDADSNQARAVQPPQQTSGQGSAHQSSDSKPEKVSGQMGSAQSQDTSKNQSIASHSAGSNSTSTGEENSIGATGQSGDKPTKGSSRVDRALEKLTQVRPPQVPHDEAGGGTIQVKLDMSRD